MKLTAKLLTASLLAAGTIAAHAGEPFAYVHGGTTFAEPARAAVPVQMTDSPAYVASGEIGIVRNTDNAPRMAYKASSADIGERAQAFVGGATATRSPAGDAPRMAFRPSTLEVKARAYAFAG